MMKTHSVVKYRHFAWNSWALWKKHRKNKNISNSLAAEIHKINVMKPAKAKMLYTTQRFI